MKTILSIIFSFCVFLLSAQPKPGSEVITLNNGTQLVGKIIEMQPGKSITILQEVTGDTLTIATTDIAKTSRIVITSQKEKKDSLYVKNSTDNQLKVKRMTTHLSYTIYYYDDYRRARKSKAQGILISFGKTHKNIYTLGTSFGFLFNRYNHIISSSEDVSMTKLLFPILIENKFRLAHTENKFKSALLLSLNGGYVFNFSNYYRYARNRGSEYATESGAFNFQALLGFKVNFDKNSGYLFEGGINYLPTRYKISNYDGLYIGHRQETNPIGAVLRISYYF